MPSDAAVPLGLPGDADRDALDRLIAETALSDDLIALSYEQIEIPEPEPLDLQDYQLIDLGDYPPIDVPPLPDLDLEPYEIDLPPLPDLDLRPLPD